MDDAGFFIEKQCLFLNVEENANFSKRQGVGDGISSEVLVKLLPVYAYTPADFGNATEISAFAAKVRSKLRM